MSGKSSGGRVAFDIEGFVLKRTETGTEPRFFYHQKTKIGTEMKFSEPHNSNLHLLVVHQSNVFLPVFLSSSSNSKNVQPERDFQT